MKKTPINNNVVWNHHSNAVNNLNMMIHQRGQRPKPIAGTPPPLEQSHHQEWQHWQQQDRCDFRIIQQTCSLFGLDLVCLFNGLLRLPFLIISCNIPSKSQIKDKIK